MHKNTLCYFCVKILKRHLKKNGGSTTLHKTITEFKLFMEQLS